MKLNRLETAGILAAIALVLLAATFFLTQTVAHAQTSIDPCSLPGMVMLGCEEEGDIEVPEVPVDACEIASCDDDGPSLAEEINCEIYSQLMAAGEPIPSGFDASGCGGGDGDGDGNGEEDIDVCPNDEGEQTTTPCLSDEDEGEEGDEGSGGSGGGSSGGSGGSSGGGSSGGGSSGGGSSGGGSGGGTGGGSVLGATTCNYLTGFVKPDAVNDFEQVARLQAFLKVFEGADVAVNGAYDAQSIAAVHAFQKKYSSDILAPWGIRNSTGHVYLTTRKKVNEIYCDRGMTFPLTPNEQQIVQDTKAGIQSSSSSAAATTPRASTTSTTSDDRSDEDSVVDQPGSTIRNFFRRVIEWFR